ncbi:MAG TPA: hypothetical protein VNZ67_10315 [bacterium]|nr:hypothetical protein [bacterium]
MTQEEGPPKSKFVDALDLGWLSFFRLPLWVVLMLTLPGLFASASGPFFALYRPNNALGRFLETLVGFILWLVPRMGITSMEWQAVRAKRPNAAEAFRVDSRLWPYFLATAPVVFLAAVDSAATDFRHHPVGSLWTFPLMFIEIYLTIRLMPCRYLAAGGADHSLKRGWKASDGQVWNFAILYFFSMMPAGLIILAAETLGKNTAWPGTGWASPGELAHVLAIVVASIGFTLGTLVQVAYVKEMVKTQTRK